MDKLCCLESDTTNEYVLIGGGLSKKMGPAKLVVMSFRQNPSVIKELDIGSPLSECAYSITRLKESNIFFVGCVSEIIVLYFSPSTKSVEIVSKISVKTKNCEFRCLKVRGSDLYAISPQNSLLLQIYFKNYTRHHIINKPEPAPSQARLLFEEFSVFDFELKGKRILPSYPQLETKKLGFFCLYLRR